MTVDEEFTYQSKQPPATVLLGSLAWIGLHCIGHRCMQYVLRSTSLDSWMYLSGQIRTFLRCSSTHSICARMPLDAMFGRQLELKQCQTFEINEFWTANAMMNDSFSSHQILPVGLQLGLEISQEICEICIWMQMQTLIKIRFIVEIGLDMPNILLLQANILSDLLTSGRPTSACSIIQ